ncbi:MAG: glucose-6-phosphate 1-dehydrogenase, partial [Aliidongia sp.]|nr:glucose-6-phosphate 1-dehydrogenase [Aliidongia sp.]
MQKIIPVASCDFIVFGGTGDLSMRKLLPSLYFRDRDLQLTDDSRIILASRTDLTTADIGVRVREALETYIPADALGADVWDRFVQRLSYVALDATAERGWDGLQALLGSRNETIR